MLNRPLRLGVRHRAFVIGWWERLVPVTVGLFVAGLTVLLVLAYAGVPMVRS